MIRVCKTGMFVKDIVDTSLLGEGESATWLPPSQPGPPPVGLFLTDETGGPNRSRETQESVSFESATGGGSSPATYQAPSSSSGFLDSLKNIRQGQLPKVRSSLVLLNVILFTYQFLSTAYTLVGQRSTPIWPNAVTGNVAVSVQPLMRDWIFTSRLASWQPHRYLTSGFVHSGILHLILNMDSFRRIPGNLEETVGSDVFGTTVLLALVGGHFAHGVWGDAIGATGLGAGIAGLYGLFGVYEFMKVKNNPNGQKQVALSVGKGLGRQLVYGLCLPRMFSNWANLGGFAAGIAGGLVFHGTKDSSSGGKRNVAVMAVWIASLSAILLLPQLRTAPLLILRSLVQPGSLTAGRTRLFYKSI